MPIPSGDTSQWRAGVGFMLAGTFIVPGMDAIAKMLSADMSSAQITWGRFAFQCLALAIPMLLFGGPHSFQTRIAGIHALRGFLLAAATGLFFLSLRTLPLADAIAIFFIQPMILTLLSSIFLDEKIGWHRRIAVLGGFVGALLIIKPGTSEFVPASLLPVATAFFFSCYLVLTRAYSQPDTPMTMQFFSGLSAVVLLSLLLPIWHFLVASGENLPPAIINPSLEQWLWLAAIGLISALGHLLVVMGMQRAPASVLAPFCYTEIIAATVLGWWVFGDWPEMLTWLGILIIVASGWYVFHREQKIAST